jgi:cytochrome c
MIDKLFVAGLSAHLSLACGGVAMAADVDRGKIVFQQCVACHSERPGALGPSLRGVLGRKSASVEGFRYSDAMTRANLTWDEPSLRAYISNPQATVKGNRMPFSGLNNPADLDDLIAFLKDYK